MYFAFIAREHALKFKPKEFWRILIASAYLRAKSKDNFWNLGTI